MCEERPLRQLVLTMLSVRIRRFYSRQAGQRRPPPALQPPARPSSLVPLLPPVAQHLGQHLHLAAALGVAIVLVRGGIHRECRLRWRWEGRGVRQDGLQTLPAPRLVGNVSRLPSSQASKPGQVRVSGTSEPLLVRAHLGRFPLGALQQVGVVADLQKSAQERRTRAVVGVTGAGWEAQRSTCAPASNKQPAHRLCGHRLCGAGCRASKS